MITTLVLSIRIVEATDLTNLSEWAENDVAHAITLGYVLHVLRGNWQDNSGGLLL